MVIIAKQLNCGNALEQIHCELSVVRLFLPKTEKLRGLFVSGKVNWYYSYSDVLLNVEKCICFKAGVVSTWAVFHCYFHRKCLAI